MQNLNESLQAKYPHLELAILPLSQVNKDNESKRIDSEYFKKEYLENEERLLNSIQFDEMIELLTDGKHGGVTLTDNGVLFLRNTNIKDGFIDIAEPNYISQEESNATKRAEFKEGDILLSTIGTVGLSAVVPKNFPKATINQNLVRIVLKDGYLSGFVSTFLNCYFGRSQVLRMAAGNVYQMINYPNLRKIKIPLFPKPFQLEIEKLVKQSHEALEDSKRLYKEAQELLYKELELDFKNPLKSLLKSSLQAKKPSELAIINDISKKYPHLNISVRPLSKSLHKSGRLDSEYYQSKYDLMENKIKSFSHKKLGELVSIQKSIEPGSEAYQDEGIEFVRVANLGKFGLSKSDIYLNEQDFSKELKKLAPKKETILLSKDGSIGISYCLEEDLECITSGAILHLKVKDKREILPQVLSLILNSIVAKLQAERDAGGSIIAHWKISEIEKVLIPLFDFKLQEQIALKIQKSFTLRAKAKDLLQNAKIKLENAIEMAN